MNEKEYRALVARIEEIEMRFSPPLYLTDERIDRQNAGREPVYVEPNFAEFGTDYEAAAKAETAAMAVYEQELSEWWDLMCECALSAYRDRAEQYSWEGIEIPSEVPPAPKEDPKLITIRVGSGKAHPAIQFQNGTFMVTCRCPGANNGRLNKGKKVADGHAAVTCRK